MILANFPPMDGILRIGCLAAAFAASLADLKSTNGFTAVAD